MTSQRFLPYGRQVIDDDDVAAVAAALRDDFLTGGPAVERFESAFAKQVGAAQAVSCNSGTAALHLAMLGMGIGPGHAVVVPSMTFVATANAVRFVGGEVVFADVDPATGLLSVESLERAIATAGRLGLRLKAVSVVHLAGNVAPLDGIARAAREYGLPLVEDACHALGSEYEVVGSKPTRIGDCAYSAAATFSFHPVKTITVGEGGMVTTNDVGLAERMRLARSHGITRDPGSFENVSAAFDSPGRANPWYYEMHDLGYNFRLPDLLCALGQSQLAKLGRFVERRRQLAAAYSAELAPLAPAVRPVPLTPGCEPALHLYAVHVDFDGIGISRREFMEALRSRGIGTQVHYIPVHLQPYYRKRYGAISLPGAEAYYRQALSLPLFPAMRDEDVTRVVRAIADTVRR